MIDAFVIVAPVLLLLLVGMLLRFIGCASFTAAPDDQGSSTTLLPDTATTLKGSPNPSSVGDLVTFTATVTNMTNSSPVAVGDVDLKEDFSLLDTQAPDVSGSVTFKKAFSSPGTHSIKAIYSGLAGQFNPSLSPVWPQVVVATSISYQQGIDNVDNTGTSTNVILNRAFAANVGPGNLIVVWIWYNSAVQRVSSVTDSAGNTYQSAIGPTLGAGGLATLQQEIWFAKNVLGGAGLIVTANFSGKFTAEKAIAAFEYKGADQISPLDQTASSTGNSVNVSVGPRPVKPNELVFAAAVFSNAGAPGPGFSPRSSLRGNVAEDELVSSAGSVAATFSANPPASPQDWIAQMVTFK